MLVFPKHSPLTKAVTAAERIAQPETMLAALIDYIEAVGCYDASGECLSDHVPVVKQARTVLGDQRTAPA